MHYQWQVPALLRELLSPASLLDEQSAFEVLSSFVVMSEHKGHFACDSCEISCRTSGAPMAERLFEPSATPLNRYAAEMCHSVTITSGGPSYMRQKMD